MNSENILICFCKHPDAGMVKSRLAKDLGNVHAAKIYNILLGDTLNNTCQANIKSFLYCYPNIRHPILEQYSENYKFELREQADGDLGMKMYQAIKTHLTTNKNIVLIGSDCIELDSDYIQQAFDQLENGNNIVLGPTEDGGYSLIGANKIDKTIFEGIEWSSDQVLKQTLLKITNLGWKYSRLPTVRDLDTLEDFQYFSTHKKYQHLFS